MADARAEQWVPEGGESLRAFAEGWLTEDERREVLRVVEFIVEAVRADRISVHFGEYLIKKLGEEQAEAWYERNRGR